MVNDYEVILLHKHSRDTAIIQVAASDEDEAIDMVDMMIDNDENYAHFREGWKISEAIEV
jgi:hypothetical protein